MDSDDYGSLFDDLFWNLANEILAEVSDIICANGTNQSRYQKDFAGALISEGPPQAPEKLYF